MRFKSFYIAVLATAIAAVPVRADDTKGVAAPAKAGEFHKYVPADSKLYVHVSVPKFFSSQMVRKGVPLAFDKFSEQILGAAGMIKGLPNVPPIDDDQIKNILKQLADADFIAQIFDSAQEVVKDVVVTGNPTPDGNEMVTILKAKADAITNENVDGIAMFIGQIPQIAQEVKAEKLAKPNGTVWALTIIKQNKKMFITVPEAGVMHIAMSEKLAEASLGAAGKPAGKLAASMAKQNPVDFVFVASTTGPEFEAMAMNVVLDANLAVKVASEVATEEAAANIVKMAKQKLAEGFDEMKKAIGPTADAFKPHFDKAEVTASGKTVTATMSISGSTVESALKKDKK